MHERIAPAPYRCPHCGARVKHAPLRGAGPIDRVYVCLCMVAFLRRDSPNPRSSGEWNELRLKGEAQEVRHKATVAEGRS